MVKRTLTWWYYRKIRKNEEKLDQLREKKSKLLDEVMEKETYKVAKEILDKYGSGIEGFKPKPSTVAASISGKPSSSSPSAGGGAASSELRRRTAAAAAAGPGTQMPVRRDDLNSSVRQGQQLALTSASPRPPLDSR